MKAVGDKILPFVKENVDDVLLVEDEEIELETLRDYIDWKKNGISRVFTRAMAEGHWSAWKKIWQIL